MNYINKLLTMAMTACLACLLLASCNESVVDPLRENYPENKTGFSNNHVLWIVLDGAGGTAVKQANNDRKMPVLRTMLQHSLYTFNGLADTRSDTLVSETLGWDNLLTGVEKHTTSTPSAFQRMKELRPDSRIALYATTDYLYDTVGKEAENPVKANSDQDAVSQFTTAFAKDGEAPDLTVIELNDVQKAGEQHGFVQESGDNAGQPTNEVIDALTAIDGSINKIMEALKKRTNYSEENWLVIITSNYGGVEDNSGNSVFEMKDRTLFTMLYNEKFTSRLLLAPSSEDGRYYNYFTPVYSGVGKTDYAKVNDPGLFDFKTPTESNSGDTTSYTIQFMFKSPINASKLTFLSKATHVKPTKGNGWEIRADQDDYLVRAAGHNGYTSQNRESIILDKRWHVCTIVFDYKQTHTLLTYVDGVNVSRNYVISNWQINTDSLAALTIGKIYKSETRTGTFYMTNLQIYNIALPADYIARNYKLTGLEQQNIPYWDNLIGYWPCDREEDFKEGILKDYSKYGSVYGGINAGKSDMTLSDNAAWIQGSDVDDNIQPVVSTSFYQSTISLTDIPYQTFQWLGLDILSSWGWSGIAHTLPYTDLNSDN